MENIKEIKKKVNDTDVNKELLKIFKEGEAESFFPGYVVNEIEDHCGEIIITMVTSTEDSPEADEFREFTEGGNIEIGECDGDVYIFCYGYDEGSKQFRIRFNWDGTERDFKDKLDIYLKELGYKNNKKMDKLIVTLYINNGKNDPSVFNWIADNQREAVSIIEKTIKEIREDIFEDFIQQGYEEEDIEDLFPGTKEWYKDKRGKRNYCCFNIDGCYYEFYIRGVEDKTKNFFWNCSE